MKCRLIIPARYASTRLPRKLLLAETGKPLICHTADAALAACRLDPDLFTGVSIATDHEEIARAVEEYAAAGKYPLTAVMTSPDHQSGSDRIAEAADKLDDPADILINLQGDEPEIEPALVVRLGRFMQQHPKTGIATLAYPITAEDAQNPNLVKVVTSAEGGALYFSRSPIPYDRAAGKGAPGLGHVGIYAYRRDVLLQFVSLPKGKLEALESLEQLRALEYGFGIHVLALESCPAKGIDTPEDYSGFVDRMKRKGHAR